MIRTVPAGVAPQGLKYHDQYVYVANSGFNGAGYDPGKISVVSVNDYTIDEIPVGTNPQSLDFDTQGNLIVACSGNYTTIPAQLDIIDAGSSSVSFTQSLPIPVTNIFVSPEDRAYLATYTDGVMVYNLTDRQFLRDNSNSLPGGPGVAFDAQNNIYVCHFDLDSLYVYSPDLEKLEAYLVGDGPVSVAVYDPFPTGIDIGKPEFPGDFHLYPNFPNPFNPKTSVRFQISTMSDIFVDIINLRGQQVKTLLEGCVKPGTYTIKWDGTNDHEAPVASGVYLLRLSNGNQQQVQKIQLVR
ncbi:MAG: T9SS C-terminal target domain-containing protein [Calditrichaeota bacterium]|nr:MAG: T9SS C-terminal target domain-containing protein [Calditrichota bacterium]